MVPEGWNLAAQVAEDRAVGRAVGRAVCGLENRAENRALDRSENRAENRAFNRSENRSEDRPEDRSAKQVGEPIACGRVERRAGSQVAGRKGPEGWAGPGRCDRQVVAWVNCARERAKTGELMVLVAT